MASEYNCTQFTDPFPEPGTEEAGNSTIPWLIITVVQLYRPYHYYLLTSIVIFAFFANILIVIVLSHKEMRRHGVNVTMLLIAVCDFGCSVAGLTQLYLRNYSDNYSSYLTAYGQITVDYLTVSFHASSLYLAVGMAFCRVMSLNFANKHRDHWQSPKYALRVGCALCFPVFVVGTFVFFINAVKDEKIDRSSRFIQFVLVVFLVTESPQGIFSIIGGFAINDYINYLQTLSIFMNILAFFNTTTSFIIYSALSAKFRKRFVQLFLPRRISNRIGMKRSTLVVQSIAHSSRTA